VMWDSLKAGAGVFSIALGYVVKGLAAVWDAMIDLAKKLRDSLPEDLRPGWLNKLDNAKIGKAGDGLIKWGQAQLDGFGNSVAQVDKWFDKIENKQKQRQADVARNAGEVAKQIQAQFAPVEAALKGSKQEYDIMTKFDWDSKWGNQQKADQINQKQLDEARKANAMLEQIKQAIADNAVSFAVV
jgi:hypothetical protein